MNPKKTVNVALISMPMATISRPSIQLGTLKSILISNDFNVDDLYLHIEFAKEIGIDFHESICLGGSHLIGDWFFGQEAFDLPLDEGYFNLIDETLASFQRKHLSFVDVKKKLIEIREKCIPQWVNKIASQISWEKYGVVGFSCTFSQTVASIAMAKKIKSTSPEIKIIFGGSCFDGPASEELSKQLDFIDCVVTGEGEEVLVELCKMINKGISIPRVLQAPQLINLKTNPVPNYDTYYEFLRSDPELSALENGQIGPITFETSRGCWWGQKSQCTFCGVNGSAISYRKKDPEQILMEIDSLAHQYGRYDFCATDNIMDSNFFKTVIPKLIEGHTSYSFFFEIKANLTYEQMVDLAKAGIIFLQPGIESLNTNILRLMKKGVSALQNLEVLKWARELDIGMVWNIIYGFPGEAEEDYSQMSSIIPKILHYQPPLGANRLRLDRFSPLFVNAQESKFSGSLTPFKNIRPIANYKYCYPSNFDLENIAYSFTFDSNMNEGSEVYSCLQTEVRNWINAWITNAGDKSEKPSLTLKRGLNFGHVIDQRNKETKVLELEGSHFQIARVLSEKATTFHSLVEKLDVDTKVVREICDEMISENLVLEIDKKLLWLPTNEKSKIY